MLLRRTPMPAQLTALRSMSAKRAAQLVEAGKPPVPTQRGRDTGPSRLVVGQVWRRAGGMCEFPACGRPAQDPHHRYERGNGGTGPKSPAAPWINLTGNVLAACRPHNDWCSNGSPKQAEAMGWIIKDAEVPACRVPVLTCHSTRWVLLDNHGGYQEVAP